MSREQRKELRGPFVWHGDELGRDDGWIMPWSGAEIAELDAAVALAARSGLTWRDIAKDDFPLDRVADRLDAVAEALENGAGLVKLTGLPVDRYDEAELRLLWMGIGRHLGTPVAQNRAGDEMRDIHDEGGDTGARYGQIAQNDGAAFISSAARVRGNGQLRYHTDRADVVGLLCVGRPKSGGVSRISSTPAIHNAILARRPDLLELLFQPIHRSRLGEESPTGDATYALPVFGLRDGKFTSHYSRTYVEAAQMVPATPRMSDQQWEALDLLVAVADELCHEMTLEPGDIQFLNNHVIYHARAPFEDDLAAGHKRMLYRLWISMPNSRPLPADHAVLWGNVEAGALRGGIGRGDYALN